MIKFLVKEGRQPTEIYKRLVEVWGEACPSRTTVFDWARRFAEGRTELTDDPREGRPSTAVTPEMIEAVEQIVMGDRRITASHVAEALGISKERVEFILAESLHMHKVTSRWVPRMLMPDQKAARVEVSTLLLDRYKQEGPSFLSRIITGDETWVHYYEPESKQQSRQWKHEDSPPPVKFKVQASVGKVMMIIFWDERGVILQHMVTEGATVTGEYYAHMLETELKPALLEKRRGLQSHGVLFLHDNARPHTAHVSVNAIHQLGWAILPHPPYSPDLAPCDYYLFADLKKYLRGKSYSSRSAIGSAVYQWSIGHSEDWFAAGIGKLPVRWEKCISVKGGYLEKEK